MHSLHCQITLYAFHSPPLAPADDVRSPKPSIQMERKKKRERKRKKTEAVGKFNSTGCVCGVFARWHGMAHTGNRSLDLSLAKKGRDCSRKHFKISMKIQRSVSQCGQARAGPTETAAQALFSHSVLSLRVLSLSVTR